MQLRADWKKSLRRGGFRAKSFDKRKLEKIQERALRAVFKSRTESYSVLLKKASLPTLYQRRLQEIATLMYKVKNGLVPHYISELFQTIPKGCNLRNANFNIPRIRSTHYGKHLLRFFGTPFIGKVARDRAFKNSFNQSINKKVGFLLLFFFYLIFVLY